jgi:hypothetical protein
MDNFADLLSLLKNLLKVGCTDTSRDSELSALLNGAIAACETYTDDIISRRTVTERVLRGRMPFRLRYRLPGDLSVVEIDGEDVLADWEIIRQDAYGKLRRIDETDYPLYDEEMVISYDAGFTECPYDLMLAIRDTAAAISAQSAAGVAVPGRAIKRETINGIGTVEYDLDSALGGVHSVGYIPPQSIQILNFYRNIGV